MIIAPGEPSEPIKSLRIRPWNEIASALELALDAAVADGVRISQNSRLRMFVKYMRREGSDFPASERREQMSQIRSESEAIVAALDHLRATPEVKGWGQQLERVQTGTVFAGSHQDKAREAQVELVMAGAMRSTGAGVSFGNPDACAIYKGHTIHFEAKRPSSDKNLSQLIRKGRSQLSLECKKTGGVGVLFVDFSQLATEHAQLYEVVDYDEALARIAPRLGSSIERLGSRVSEWVHSVPEQSACVFAVFGLVKARFRMPNDAYGTMNRIIVGAMTATEADIPPWFKDFVDGFARINQVPLPEQVRTALASQQQ